MRSRFSISNYSNLAQRIITATIGAVVIIVGSLYSEWAYFIIFGIVLAISQMEFYKLCGLDGMIPLKTFGTFVGLAVFTFTFLEEMKILPPQFYFLVFPLVSMIFFIKLYRKSDKKPFTGIAFTILGIFYVAIPFALLNLIAFSVDNTFHSEIIIGSLLILWASDSGSLPKSHGKGVWEGHLRPL
jgi:phosphatidate cytidylyltransferase